MMMIILRFYPVGKQVEGKTMIIMVIVPGRFTGSRFTCGCLCACPCLIILAIDTVTEKIFKVSRRGQDHLQISGFIEILSIYRENYLCLFKSLPY